MANGKLTYIVPQREVQVFGRTEKIGGVQALFDSLNKTYYVEDQAHLKFLPKGASGQVFSGIVDSFNQYGDDWEKLLTANYKVPRIAEEQTNQAKQASQNVQAQYQQAAGMNDLLIAAQSSLQQQPKSISASTGLAKAKSSASPFSFIESGLNI